MTEALQYGSETLGRSRRFRDGDFLTAEDVYRLRSGSSVGGALISEVN